jgi:hypothetical protein
MDGHVNVYATTCERSAADLRKINMQITAMFEKRGLASMHIDERLNCKQMFTEYASDFV